MPGRFDGKRVLITGAAGGIGCAIVEAFAAEGALVGAIDLKPESLTVAEALDKQVLRLQADISKEADVEAAVAKAAAAWGGVDVLVNNAAAFVYGDVTTVSSEAWDRVLGVNVKGTAFCCKHAIPHMRKAGGGAVVIITSISASTAQTEFVPYSTTKGALAQMCRNLAADHARDGIRVNCVSPGPILTPATSLHAASMGKSLEEVVGELTSHLLLKRMGKPTEVAKAVLFLASDDASFTTGSTLNVDGGYTIV